MTEIDNTILPTPFHKILMDQLEEFINKGQSVFKEWKNKPPHILGLIVSFAVALELVITNQLFHGWGGTRLFISLLINRFILILGATALMVLLTHRTAGLFGKKGKRLVAFTLLTLSLLPFLLYLPISFLVWSMGGSEGLAGILLLVFILKVLADWRSALQLTYRLTPLQSILVLSAAGSLVYIIMIAIFLIGSLTIVARILSLIPS